MEEELRLQCLKSTVKGGSGSINTWGGFLMHGMGPIHKINGIIDQTIYKNIMKDVLLYSEEYLPLNQIFMQDNDPKHKAKFFMKFFEDKKVNLLTWPPHSSDLNPLENVWGEIGRALNDQKCKSLEELYENVQKFWYNFPKKKIEKYISTMPKRYQQVIKNDFILNINKICYF